MAKNSLDVQVFDIVIVGGGPAGTTAGTLLARCGYKVALLERGTHPRFHIGESLLPMNLPIFEILGISEDVRRIGVEKPGADFTPPDGSDHHRSFLFSRALGDSPPHAYQVRRSEFDQLLFENCRKSGVTTVEKCRVTKIDLSEDNCHLVHAVDDDDREVSVRCRYLLDASGQDTVLASQRKWRIRNREHAAAAMFAHFKGVTFRDGDETGDISIYWFKHGWIWMIPLTDEVMSIGVVCQPDYLKSRRESQDDFLLSTLRLSPAAADRAKDATQLQPAQTAANYSYYSREQVGPGFALIGDAYAFVDPVFSSGVYLAMSSARDIVPVVECWLSGDVKGYRASSRAYCRRIRRGIRTFSWFIYRFTSPTMAQLFRQPRNVLGVEQAVISMLAGNVFDDRTVRVRLWLFKCIFQSVRAVNRIRRTIGASDPSSTN